MKLCRECRDYLEAYRRTMEIGQAVFSEPDESVPGAVPEDLVNAILAARKSWPTPSLAARALRTIKASA
jgi:hypothetical protein